MKIGFLEYIQAKIIKNKIKNMKVKEEEEIKDILKIIDEIEREYKEKKND